MGVCLSPHVLTQCLSVAGVISLPYAEIQEPFEAWYNLTGGVSRINYYHGELQSPLPPFTFDL